MGRPEGLPMDLRKRWPWVSKTHGLFYSEGADALETDC